MSNLSIRQSLTVLLCFFVAGYSLIINAECSQCADLAAKIKKIAKNSARATDNEVQDALSSLCTMSYCACCSGLERYSQLTRPRRVEGLVEALFADESLQRIKSYFNKYPERLNERGLERLICSRSAAVRPFAAIVADHLDVVKRKTLISYLLAADINCRLELIDGAVAHIGNIKPEMLCSIAGEDAGALKSFMDALAENDTGKTIFKLLVLVIHTKDNGYADLHVYGWKIIEKKLSTIIVQKKQLMKFKYLLLGVLYKGVYGTMPNGFSAQLPTAQHLLSLADQLKNGPSNNGYYSYGANYIWNYVTHKRAKKVVDSILTAEKEFADAGYYTFVHGQRWEYRLLELWYTWLWELEQNRSAGEYTFIHCRKLKKGKALEKQRELRKQIIQKGRLDLKERKRLLFMNAPFFGNLSNQGSCTAHFAYSNSNINQISFSLADIFKMFDCEGCYNKYKHELEELENEHQTLSKRGQVLLLAVPKNIIKDCVYCAAPGGYRRTVSIDGCQTEDIEQILEALRTNASRIDNPDYMEFCLTLTDDMLTPDSGIKVCRFAMADEEKIRAFDAKARNLFERMKADVQQESKNAITINKSVDRINELCEHIEDQNVEVVKMKINHEVLSKLSDKEREIVTQRMLCKQDQLCKVVSCDRSAYNCGVHLSPGGTLVAGVYYEKNLLRIRNLLTGQDNEIAHQLGTAFPSVVSFSPDDRYMVNNFYNETTHSSEAIIWDRVADTIEQVADPRENSSQMPLSVSNNFVFFYDEDNKMNSGYIHVYDLEKHLFAHKIACSRLNNFAFYTSIDEKYFVSLHGLVWDNNTGKSVQVGARIRDNGHVLGLASVAGEYYFVCVGSNYWEIMMVDMISGQLAKQLNLSLSMDRAKVARDGCTLAYTAFSHIGSCVKIHRINLLTDIEKVYSVGKNLFVQDFNENLVLTGDGQTCTVWSYNDKRSDLIKEIFS